METDSALAALAALAQTTRLDAFRLLVRQEPEGVAAGAIARMLRVPQNTLSSHLAVLVRAGLITAERHSRSIVYRSQIDTLRQLMLFLAKDCYGGDAELRDALPTPA